MSQKNVPKELNARRDKILSLYKDGLSVADIAKKKGKMDQILQARDASLLSLTEDEILKRGFWKRPSEYQKAGQKQNKEVALQTELRIIGFRKNDICRYMGYSSIDQVEAVRHNTDDFLVAQQNLAFRYYKNTEIKSTWTCDELVEF